MSWSQEKTSLSYGKSSPAASSYHSKGGIFEDIQVSFRAMNTQAKVPFRQEPTLMFNEQRMIWENELRSDFTYNGFKLPTSTKLFMFYIAA